MSWPSESFGPVSLDLYGLSTYLADVFIFRFDITTLSLKWAVEIDPSTTQTMSVSGIGIPSTEDKAYFLTYHHVDDTHQIFEVNTTDGALLRNSEFDALYSIIGVNRKAAVKMDSSDNYLYLIYVGQAATPPIPNAIVLNKFELTNLEESRSQQLWAHSETPLFQAPSPQSLGRTTCFLCMGKSVFGAPPLGLLGR